MGEELDDLIKANDWQGVSRILRKQLIIWGLLAVIATAIGIISFIQGKPRFGISLGAAFFIWRVIQLARLYRTSRDNERWLQEEAEGQQTIEEQIARIQAMLSGCNVTRVRDGITPEALMEMWKETRECGKREGFCPVLLLVDSNFVESMDDDTVEDRERFRQWQYQMLNAPVADGHTLLKERFESLKSDYETDCDWQTDIVGTAQICEAVNDFSSFDGHFLLAEIPVNEPWQIFAYFPFAGWNDCPSAEEHMAVAKYWYEKYNNEYNYNNNDNASLWKTYNYAAGKWPNIFPIVPYIKGQHKMRTILTTEIYAYGNWCYPPIVTAESFEKAKTKMSKN